MIHLILASMMALHPATAGDRHGLEIRLEKHPPVVVVICSFEGGGPVMSGSVQITAPSDEEPFQTGRTDRNGRFSFSPDISGLWRIVVDDGMGHRQHRDLEIARSFFEESAASHDPGLPEGEARSTESELRFARVILGIALILAISGAAYLFKVTRT